MGGGRTVFIESPKRGGGGLVGARGGGGGAGRVFAGNLGGGVVNIFFRAEIPTKEKTERKEKRRIRRKKKDVAGVECRGLGQAHRDSLQCCGGGVAKLLC